MYQIFTGSHNSPSKLYIDAEKTRNSAPTIYDIRCNYFHIETILLNHRRSERSLAVLIRQRSCLRYLLFNKTVSCGELYCSNARCWKSRCPKAVVST